MRIPAIGISFREKYFDRVIYLKLFVVPQQIAEEAKSEKKIVSFRPKNNTHSLEIRPLPAVVKDKPIRRARCIRELFAIGECALGEIVVAT